MLVDAEVADPLPRRLGRRPVGIARNARRQWIARVGVRLLADVPPGEDPRELHNVLLRVPAVHAHGVQLHQLAGEVLVRRALHVAVGVQEDDHTRAQRARLHDLPERSVEREVPEGVLEVVMELRTFVLLLVREERVVEPEEIRALGVVGVEVVVPEERDLLLELAPGVHGVHEIERLQLLDRVRRHQGRAPRHEIGVGRLVDRRRVELLVDVPLDPEGLDAVPDPFAPAVPEAVEVVVAHEHVAGSPQRPRGAVRVVSRRPFARDRRLRRDQVEISASGGGVCRSREGRPGDLVSVALGPDPGGEPGDIAPIDVVVVRPRGRAPGQVRRLVDPVAGHLPGRGGDRQPDAGGEDQRGQTKDETAEDGLSRSGPRTIHGVPSENESGSASVWELLTAKKV